MPCDCGNRPPSDGNEALVPRLLTAMEFERIRLLNLLILRYYAGTREPWPARVVTPEEFLRTLHGRPVVVPGVDLEGMTGDERDRAMARWLFSPEGSA